jgi:hypothetical protein
MKFEKSWLLILCAFLFTSAANAQTYTTLTPLPNGGWTTSYTNVAPYPSVYFQPYPTYYAAPQAATPYTYPAYNYASAYTYPTYGYYPTTGYYRPGFNISRNPWLR